MRVGKRGLTDPAQNVIIRSAIGLRMNSMTSSPSQLYSDSDCTNVDGSVPGDVTKRPKRKIIAFGWCDWKFSRPDLILLLLAALFAVLLTAGLWACGESEVPPGVEAAMEIERGIELVEDGHLVQARTAFGSAIAKDGKNAEAYARRGFVSLALEDTRSAMSDLNRAIDLNADLALAYNFRGVAYAVLGDDDQAVLDLTRAVALDPTMSEAYLNRAGVYLKSDDPRAALSDLDTASELDQENPSLYLVRAQVHLVLGNMAQAEADLLQVMSVSSDDDELAAARRLLAGIR